MKIDGVKRPFPRLSRRLPPLRMWQEHEKWSKEERKLKDCVKESSFCKIVNELARDSARIVRAIDCVTGILVSDSFSILQRIMLDSTNSAHKREECGKRIAVSKNFLKSAHKAHLTLSNATAMRCITHGLSKEPFRDELNSDCDSCKGPFKLIDDMSCDCFESAGARGEKLKDAILECRAKIHLFMGHRIRAASQQMH